MYYRGGMTLQALREKIGDLAFFQLLRDVGDAEPARHRHDAAVHRARGTGAAGQDLTQFFKVWIYQADKPAPGSW